MGTKTLTVVVPDDVEEVIIRFKKKCQVTETAPLIRRCRAVKRDGGRCRHTSTTSPLSEEGLCLGAHKEWITRGRQVVPMTELWVPR